MLRPDTPLPNRFQRGLLWLGDSEPELSLWQQFQASLGFWFLWAILVILVLLGLMASHASMAKGFRAGYVKAEVMLATVMSGGSLIDREAGIVFFHHQKSHEVSIK